MKNEVSEFLARCIECQQVKVEHQHLAGLLKQLPIPNWKWEVISLDFLTDLPKNQKHNNSIMVVVDKLSKASHFIHVKTTYTSPNVVDIFMKKSFIYMKYQR